MRSKDEGPAGAAVEKRRKAPESCAAKRVKERPATNGDRPRKEKPAGGGPVPYAASARSAFAITRVVFITASGLSEMLSIPSSTRKRANSG